jgi:hypothetical protein
VHKDHLVVKVFKVPKGHRPSDPQVLKGLKEMLVTKVLIVVVILQDLKVLKGRQELKALKDKVEDQVHKVLKGNRATQDLQEEQVQLDHHLIQE